MKLLEREFADQLFGTNGLATILGWHAAHFRPAMNRRGIWSTPVAGELGKGWPDWFLCHPVYGHMFRELKRDGETVTEDQARVMAILEAGGCNVGIWHPIDLDSGRILLELR